MFFLYFFRNMELRCTILHQSFVQISFVGLENNLSALYANNACFWHQGVAKIRHNARILSFVVVNITLYTISLQKTEKLFFSINYKIGLNIKLVTRLKRAPYISIYTITLHAYIQIQYISLKIRFSSILTYFCNFLVSKLILIDMQIIQIVF